MKRSAVLGIALLGALGGLPVEAQQAGKTYRVGILSGRTPAADRLNVDAFRHALSGLGYEEGKNLEIVYRGVGGDYARLSALAAELVRAKLDAIVTQGSNAAAVARRATMSVPIVMVEVADPVGVGLVAGLARPGGNVTGVENMNAALVGKQLQLLKELVPRLRRVAVVLNPTNPSNPIGLRATQTAARTIGITAVAADMGSAAQIDAGVKTLPSLRADAALVLGDGMLTSNEARIVRLMAALRLPAVYAPSAFATAGGLMVYGVSTTAQWSQAATYVDRILKGAKPADLPVENPAIFELVVNLKTARSLGLTVPQSILLRADRVIK